MQGFIETPPRFLPHHHRSRRFLLLSIIIIIQSGPFERFILFLLVGIRKYGLIESTALDRRLERLGLIRPISIRRPAVRPRHPLRRPILASFFCSCCCCSLTSFSLGFAFLLLFLVRAMACKLLLIGWVFAFSGSSHAVTELITTSHYCVTPFFSQSVCKITIRNGTKNLVSFHIRTKYYSIFCCC